MITGSPAHCLDKPVQIPVMIFKRPLAMDFIHSINQHIFFNSYYMRGTILGTGDILFIETFILLIWKESRIWISYRLCNLELLSHFLNLSWFPSLQNGETILPVLLDPRITRET